MKDLEKELHVLHQAYAESGQAQKDIEEYEAKLDQEKLAKKQKEIDEMNALLKEKTAKKAEVQKIPIPFSEITMVVEKSPAYLGGKYNEKKYVKIGNRSANKRFSYQFWSFEQFKLL